MAENRAAINGAFRLIREMRQADPYLTAVEGATMLQAMTVAQLTRIADSLEVIAANRPTTEPVEENDV